MIIMIYKQYTDCKTFLIAKEFKNYNELSPSCNLTNNKFCWFEITVTGEKIE